MARAGIEKLNLYAGRCYVDFSDIASARGIDPAYLTRQLMVSERSVYPTYEDPVSLAVNAAKRMLAPEDIADIELLIVGTESGVDLGKPISTWVHRFCKLRSNCRNFEVKHACYGGTGALKMAASWVASGIRPGKKALVVTTDISRNFINMSHEPIGGGGSVAMLVSADPGVLELDLEKAGYWTSEIADTFRPTSRCEVLKGETSIYSYLDALDGAYDHYEQIAGVTDYEAAFKKHIYHAPFPGMTMQAHQSMLNRAVSVSKETVRKSFETKVEESLTFARRIGTSYGSSTFVCLLGLLASATDLEAGDLISLFAYGSGCQGEFYQGRIGAAGRESAKALHIGRHLDERRRLSLSEYESNELSREAQADCPDIVPDRSQLAGVYEELFAGQGLLVLESVDNYERRYAWT